MWEIHPLTLSFPTVRLRVVQEEEKRKKERRESPDVMVVAKKVSTEEENHKEGYRKGSITKKEGTVEGTGKADLTVSCGCRRC
jgi:hypothetical protein